MSDDTTALPPLPPLSTIELESVIPLEAEPGVRSARGITTLSADAYKRNYPKLVVQLSPRRQGTKLKNALAVAAGTAARTP